MLGRAALAEDAVDAGATLVCQKVAGFLAPVDAPDHRKYAQNRDVDIHHLALDVTPDFKQRTVSVMTQLRFQGNAIPSSELRLDAVKLTVETVTATETIQAWQNTDQELVITFAKPIPSDRETTLTVRSRAEPRQGFYFRTPEMGYREGDGHFFTQGEAIEARHWYPCFDAPNDKFTSEITCRVPEGMKVFSNGRKVSEEKDPASGLVVVRWLQEQPHVNYLVSLLAGHFRTLEDHHGELPIAFHVPASDIDTAAGSFEKTKEALAFFEKETGVKYPWSKYDQICVNDFVAGGMENTSITTLTDGTLHTPDFKNLRSSEGLMAHELAHQWFGDLVTCKDWTHLWLNEGAATYYAHLFAGHVHGHDELLYGLLNDARSFLDAQNDIRPIADRTFGDPMQQFGYTAYQKGSWVLHMLRSQLGEDLYRRCIHTYLERHRFGNVVTEDLNRVIEELSGRSWDQFFDQWVYHAHHPELEVSYSWDELAKTARVSVRQIQKLGENVLLFNVPLTVRFRNGSKTEDRIVRVKSKEEDFRFPLSAAPEGVRIDPDFTLLAKVTFNPPTSMVLAQLADRSDVIGRILAVGHLGRAHDGDALTRLRGVLNDDPFYGVRVEASKTLRGIPTDAAFEALLASLKQDDARVRRQVVSDLAAFHRPRARQELLRIAEEEKNPDIRAAAVRGLGGYAGPEVRDLVLKLIGQDSYRNVLAEAAIAVMRDQDDPAYLPPLLESLARHEPAFTSWGYAGAIGTLAHLARNETNKEPYREFLVARVAHKKDAVRHAALRGLGTLGDGRVAPLLRSVAGVDKANPDRGVAESALNELNSRTKPTTSPRDVREELTELQKSNADLRREFDELKKRVDQRGGTNAVPAGKVSSPKPPKERSGHR